MKPPSLKKLLKAVDQQTLLAQFARLTDGPVTLAIFDQRGRALASYPAGEYGQLAEAAASVCRTGQPLVNHENEALLRVQNRTPPQATSTLQLDLDGRQLNTVAAKFRKLRLRPGIAQFDRVRR